MKELYFRIDLAKQQRWKRYSRLLKEYEALAGKSQTLDALFVELGNILVYEGTEEDFKRTERAIIEEINKILGSAGE